MYTNEVKEITIEGEKITYVLRMSWHRVCVRENKERMFIVNVSNTIGIIVRVVCIHDTVVYINLFDHMSDIYFHYDQAPMGFRLKICIHVYIVFFVNL